MVYLRQSDSTGVVFDWWEKQPWTEVSDTQPERTMAGDQRFVISARVIGAVQRDIPKLKVGSA